MLGEKELEVLQMGDEPTIFWWVLQMLYRWATGDSWQARLFNQQVHDNNLPAYF